MLINTRKGIALVYCTPELTYNEKDLNPETKYV